MTTAELERVFGTASAYFAVMSDATRLKILHAICSEEKPVGQIVAEAGASRSQVLRELSMMRQLGLVARRRRGRHDVYAVADLTMIELCRAIRDQIG